MLCCGAHSCTRHVEAPLAFLCLIQYMRRAINTTCLGVHACRVHIGLKEYEREREHVISSPQDMPDLAQAKQKDEND